MARDLIDSKALVDSDWVAYTLQAISGDASKYFFYIHESSDSVEIGGGPYGRQIIHPLSISAVDQDFFVSCVDRLDGLIDLDFERTRDQSSASMSFFLDSKIDIDGNTGGKTTTNFEQNHFGVESILDGRRVEDRSYLRYAFLHEYGHTLGLEHPFDHGDGDSWWERPVDE